MSVVPVVISIDGLIGAGKSTLLAYLETKYPEAIIVREPIDIWQNLKLPPPSNTQLLELYYQNPHRWAFTFQQFAFLTRLELLEQALNREPKPKLIIMERTPETDRHIFAQAQYEQGNFNHIEHVIYERWYNRFVVPISQQCQMAHIWVNTSLPIAMERIHTRNRQGEQSIPLEYLELLDQLHRNWLEPIISTRCLAIDTGIKPKLEDHFDQIDCFIQRLTSTVAKE